MVAPAVQGIDLFKIAGRSTSGWIPSLKTAQPGHVRQPFCSQMEERLLLYLEYHPQVACYARGDIGAQFATTYRLPTPKDAPFAIGYVFDDKPHDYLPDAVGTLTNQRHDIPASRREPYSLNRMGSHPTWDTIGPARQSSGRVNQARRLSTS